MKDVKKHFWKKLLNIRKEKWISQEELWRISWIHRTYISEIERWIANVSLEHINRLSEALNVPIKDLFNL